MKHNYKSVLTFVAALRVPNCKRLHEKGAKNDARILTEHIFYI